MCPNRKGKIGERKRERPICDEEKSRRIGSFNVQNVVVVEEASEQFVNDQTEDNLEPHRCNPHFSSSQSSVYGYSPLSFSTTVSSLLRCLLQISIF